MILVKNPDSLNYADFSYAIIFWVESPFVGFVVDIVKENLIGRWFSGKVLNNLAESKRDERGSFSFADQETVKSFFEYVEAFMSGKILYVYVFAQKAYLERKIKPEVGEITPETLTFWGITQWPVVIDAKVLLSEIREQESGIQDSQHKTSPAESDSQG